MGVHITRNYVHYGFALPNMYILKKFHGANFDRYNAIVDGLHNHLTGFVNLIGSATLPLPGVCEASSLPGSACRTEGHLSNRYFPGTSPIDEAEAIVEAAVRKIFDTGTNYEISAQPHSATQANQALWRSILKPGDVVLGLGISDGGHISHNLGLPFGTAFRKLPTTTSGLLDYEKTSTAIANCRPALIVVGGSSYPFGIDFDELARQAKLFNAHLHADLAHMAPYVAAGLHNRVTPFADSFTLDTGKNLRGPKGGILVFKKDIAPAVRRAIFPLMQSSPNQTAIIAKAFMLEWWRNNNLAEYAKKLKSTGVAFAAALNSSGLEIAFGGTESHILTVDLRNLNVTGAQAEAMLYEIGVLANRNAIPDDPLPPHTASGLRFGTTTLTILQYAQADLEVLAECIAAKLKDRLVSDDPIKALLKKYQLGIANLEQ